MTSEDLKNLMLKVNEEIIKEKADSLPAKEKRLNEVARKLLKLERDLSVPGAGGSDSHRQSRIMEFLENEEF